VASQQDGADRGEVAVDIGCQRCRQGLDQLAAVLGLRGGEAADINVVDLADVPADAHLREVAAPEGPRRQDRHHQAIPIPHIPHVMFAMALVLDPVHAGEPSREQQ
jgi:hypothetical protein